jgi:hypothetical protein
MNDRVAELFAAGASIELTVPDDRHPTSWTKQFQIEEDA